MKRNELNNVTETHLRTSTFKQWIRCPNCGLIDLAYVHQYEGCPFPDFTHECPNCHHTIMEQEWMPVFVAEWNNAKEGIPPQGEEVIIDTEDGRITTGVHVGHTYNGERDWFWVGRVMVKVNQWMRKPNKSLAYD